MVGFLEIRSLPISPLRARCVYLKLFTKITSREVPQTDFGQTLPFALPSHLLRSAIHPQHHDTRRGWLGVIRWDAPYTDWAQAKRRISSQITGRPSVCPQIYILAQVSRPSDAMSTSGLTEQTRA